VGKGTAKRQVADKVTAQPPVAPGHASQLDANPWFRLQRSIGNQAVLRLFHNSALQAKLAGNSPGDPYEQEADRVAEQGMRIPEPQLQRKCACGGPPGLSGECEECSKKKRLGLQTKLKVNEPGDIYEQEADRVADQVLATPAHPGVSGSRPRIQRFSANSNGQMQAAPVSVERTLASPGSPLNPALRQDMERRFGHDFSRVRVHSGPAAEQSARDVNARAYTVGHDIVFGVGSFAPETHEGRRLVAHELMHVLQQSHVETSFHRYGNTSLLPDPFTASATHVARAPQSGEGKFRIHPDAMAFLENKLRQFYQLLSPHERIRLKRNSTIAIGMATVDGEPRLVYTVANNDTNKEIRAAADKLDLHRWTYTTGVSGRGTVGAPNDAEQLMEAFATDNDVDLHGIVVSRRVCPDCGVVIPSYKEGQIELRVIEDPIPVPRGPRLAALKPPARTVSGEITVPEAPPAQTEGGKMPSTPPARGTITPETKIGPGAFPSSAAEGQEATAGAVGGAAAMIHQGQIQYLQSAEQAKADEALKNLQPEIDRLVARGRWVVVRIHFDAPKAPSITAGVFKEQSDINHFVMITYKTGDTKEEALGLAPATMKAVVGPPETYEAPKKPLGTDRTTFIADTKVYPPQYNPKAIKGPYDLWDLLDFTAGKTYVDSKNMRGLYIRWEGKSPILGIVNLKTLQPEYYVWRASLDLGKQRINAFYNNYLTGEFFETELLITPENLLEYGKRVGPGGQVQKEVVIWEKTTKE
jgi:hypothetical protein